MIVVNIPLLPKDPAKGNKPVFVTRDILVELVDLENVTVGMKIGLMRYKVFEVVSVSRRTTMFKSEKNNGICALNSILLFF